MVPSHHRLQIPLANGPSLELGPVSRGADEPYRTADAKDATDSN